MELFRNRLNQPPDPRAPFLEADAFLFAAEGLDAFDPASGEGTLRWTRHRRKPRVAFDHMTMPWERVESWEFPAVYPEPKPLPFSLTLHGDRTVRIRMRAKPGRWGDDGASLMLAAPPAPPDGWTRAETEAGWIWTGPAGSVSLSKDPWKIEVRDATGRPLLASRTLQDGSCMIAGRPIPTAFVRSAADVGHSLAVSFSLSPGERLVGCGESFERLDKRGRTVRLWTQDAHGSQTPEMYKPVPFYLSSRGYGVFVHGSAPMLFDLGDTYGEAQVLYAADEVVDLFVFLGSPQEILGAYTALTGRSPRPPLWSFGLWMSRITYESEAQVREVAGKLRAHRIPCDVIHLDTGWFEHDWRCDYEFSPSRFPDPKRMIADLRRDGFRVCLWQLPYFTPPNRLFSEIVERGLAVRGPLGSLPGDDAVLDFSNPETVAWYQSKLAGLHALGVAAIKVDFGEGAPLNGLYASGRTGWHEHNLYPLRYNAAAAEATRRATGEAIIWARSAWAGSQRYPLHWGGDAEATDGGMAGTLRGGLSLGLSGFTYWSHDAGGFFPRTPEPLYRRWLAFALLSSHARCHGLPPTEPWDFSPAFLELFRRATELRYRLLPYLWAQAADASAAGLPLLRALCIEFPDDPNAWMVEDQYLLGSDLLVAPLLEETSERDVWLPSGDWTDLQSGALVAGGRWARLAAGPVPVVLLGRGGRAIPVAEPAASTDAQDWSRIAWIRCGAGPWTGRWCAKDAATAETVTIENPADPARPTLDRLPA
jgi:alpha-D-xyloside xylohydrolase